MHLLDRLLERELAWVGLGPCSEPLPILVLILMKLVLLNDPVEKGLELLAAISS